MSFTPTRSAALDRLTAFAPRMGGQYAARRNFDLGAGGHDYVSCLSPYTRHRMVTERELVEKALEVHGLKAAEKFIDEVFWRTYWKGWLEQRPKVWCDYQDSVQAAMGRVESNTGLRKAFQEATTGQTGIDCFDHWTRELIETGYLHNHARMWFASIWIFTLKLPWALGADFFLHHLLDGDPASNTLSWRWVAGLQTEGKNYIARPSNIEKYTNGRFNPAGQLASNPEPLAFTLYQREALPNGDPFPDEFDLLLLTDDSLYPEGLLPPDALPKRAIILDTRAARSSTGCSQRVSKFVGDAMADTKARLEAAGCATTIQTPGDVVFQSGTRVIALYAPVGPSADALADTLRKAKTVGAQTLCAISDWDQTAWPYAKKGFFVFKKAIPSLIDTAFGSAAAVGGQMGFSFDG